MGVDVNIIGQSKSRPSAAPIAEVSANPDRVDLACRSGMEHPEQHDGTPVRCIGLVTNRAPRRIRVESVLEL